ncbi:hypothetical protein AB1Y20_016041 [Prymnesium parvum]|uniref:Uncharacterized protein n=1 Tax=Prymnesium parvum TaxID=97485 RepID=A0AB34K355_PRYPA
MSASTAASASGLSGHLWVEQGSLWGTFRRRAFQLDGVMLRCLERSGMRLSALMNELNLTGAEITPTKRSRPQYPHAFRINLAPHLNQMERKVVFAAESEQEKQEWIHAMCKVGVLDRVTTPREGTVMSSIFHKLTSNRGSEGKTVKIVSCEELQAPDLGEQVSPPPSSSLPPFDDDGGTAVMSSRRASLLSALSSHPRPQGAAETSRQLSDGDQSEKEGCFSSIAAETSLKKSLQQLQMKREASRHKRTVSESSRTRATSNSISWGVVELDNSNMIKFPEVTGKVATLLQEALLRQYSLKKSRCAPETFRATRPNAPFPEMADFGQILFGSAQKSSAFLHLADTREWQGPTAQPLTPSVVFAPLDRYVNKVIDFMEIHWNMSPASVIISITGGAQDFNLSPMLHSAFGQGLAKAAQATNAWLLTGGTDSGVMQLVGRSLAEYDANVNCIGIAVWDCVYGKEHLYGCRSLDEKVTLLRRRDNSSEAANLERHHSHFLLVDTGSNNWGGEIPFRFALEREYCRRKKVPRVLLVVQGGPNTLWSVLEALESDCPVILVRDSGGVATLLHDFLATYRDTSSPFYQVGEIADAFKGRFEQWREKLTRIAELDFQVRKISSFGLSDPNSGSHLDLHILNAVLNDTGQYRNDLQARLQLAVQWNRRDVVERALAAVEESDLLNPESLLRSALQVAVEHRRVTIIKSLLNWAMNHVYTRSFSRDEGGVVKLDFIKLYAANIRIFRSSETLQASLQSDMAITSIGQATSLRAFEQVLLPYLSGIVPHITERVRRMEALDADSSAYETLRESHLSQSNCGEALDVTRAGPSFSDLIFWATLVGDLELTQCFWECSRRDPIRMALLASQTARKAAQIASFDARLYLENAKQYELWACEVLRLCRSDDDAMAVLLRPHKHWPHTILRVAMSGGNKAFVGQSYVQRLVDQQWQGKTFRSSWSLPDNAGWIRIVLHAIFRRSIKMSYVSREDLEDQSSLGSTGLSDNSINIPKRIVSFRRRGYQNFNLSGVPDEWNGFLHVPRVKFTLKITSYFLFLALYLLVLYQRGGRPQIALSHLDAIFYFWAFSLWIEEIHQWYLDYSRGVAHIVDKVHRRIITSNLIDAISLTILMITLALHVAAFWSCGTDSTNASSSNNTDEHAVLGAAERGSEDSTLAVYHGCQFLRWSQLMLAWDAIFCFVRVFSWLTVADQKLGVLSVILMALLQDVQLFLVIFLLVLAGFSAALVGLMPTLGARQTGELATWESTGPFQLPFWAMFGEFGELADVSEHGSWPGTALLWSYTFVSQVLMVNLLIAMMTETYQNIKQNADDEWKFRRVFIVDEFMGTVFHWPAPVSSPMLIAQLLSSLCGKSSPPLPDLLTYKLPVNSKEATKDLHIMQDWLAKKGQKKSSDHEAQLLSNQDLMLKKMLETQETIFEMKQQIDSSWIASAEGTTTRKKPQQVAIKSAEAHQLRISLEEVRNQLERKDQELLRLQRSAPMLRLHQKARGPHPLYPERSKVADHQVDWRTIWTGYEPVSFTAQVVLDNDCTKRPGGWADPRDVALLREDWSKSSRASAEGTILFDAYGTPLNPRGRTGMRERGLLGKWGPNHAADPIVTRWDPRSSDLQIVAIKRADTGDWALPGGMVDAGETVSATVRREFEEEAGSIQEPEQRQLFRTLVDELFHVGSNTGDVVYRGYVDDPRNTDNAWMESTAFHFHCRPQLGAMLPLHAGDDAKAVMWLTINENDPKYSRLYASHKDWVDRVNKRMRMQRRKENISPPRRQSSNPGSAP